MLQLDNGLCRWSRKSKHPPQAKEEPIMLYFGCNSNHNSQSSSMHELPCIQ